MTSDRIPSQGSGSLSGIRALLFDVLGTVVDWRSGVARDVSAFLARQGATHVDPAQLADAWALRYTPSTEEVRSGRRPFTRLDVLHRENLEGTLQEFGIDPHSVPSVELDNLNLAWHRLDPWPDSIAGLKRLKTQYIIAPFSAGNTSLLLDMAKRGGIPWDAILGSDVVGVYKPAPEAYFRTIDFLALKPEEVLLVAAHNDDLAAARKCGMRTGFVVRATEHGPSQTSDLHPIDKWDVIADDLVDLAGKLGV
jgi:2-haloacid dehalogenase